MIWVFGSFVGGLLACDKGRSFYLGFCICLFLSPFIGVLVIFSLKNK